MVVSDTGCWHWLGVPSSCGQRGIMKSIYNLKHLVSNIKSFGRKHYLELQKHCVHARCAEVWSYGQWMIEQVQGGGNQVHFGGAGWGCDQDSGDDHGEHHHDGTQAWEQHQCAVGLVGGDDGRSLQNELGRSSSRSTNFQRGLRDRVSKYTIMSIFPYDQSL